MASPHVAGAVVLAAEWWRSSHSRRRPEHGDGEGTPGQRRGRHGDRRHPEQQRRLGPGRHHPGDPAGSANGLFRPGDGADRHRAAGDRELRHRRSRPAATCHARLVRCSRRCRGEPGAGQRPRPRGRPQRPDLPRQRLQRRHLRPRRRRRQSEQSGERLPRDAGRGRGDGDRHREPRSAATACPTTAFRPTRTSRSCARTAFRKGSSRTVSRARTPWPGRSRPPEIRHTVERGAAEPGAASDAGSVSTGRCGKPPGCRRGPRDRSAAARPWRGRSPAHPRPVCRSSPNP